VYGRLHVAVASVRWPSVVYSRRCICLRRGGLVVLDSAQFVEPGLLPSQHMPCGACSDRPALHSVDALRCTARRGRSFAYLPACLVYLPVYLPVCLPVCLPVTCMLAGHRIVLALLCVSFSARAARYVHGLVYSLRNPRMRKACDDAVLTSPLLSGTLPPGSLFASPVNRSGRCSRGSDGCGAALSDWAGRRRCGAKTDGRQSDRDGP
jgi:hypothetical protein